ncbi:MAG: YceI family protein [Gammaproteobacteria bacterium]|nr:YceI family protein [Gammaproteobacteria bacterium]
MRLFVILAISLIANVANAAWHVDPNASTVSFATIKADNVGESHRFTHVTGTIADDGYVNIEIDLASVDTAVEVRDQRMRDILFQVMDFPAAVITTRIEPAALHTMSIGSSKVMNTEATVTVHGQSTAVTLAVRVSRLGENLVQIASEKLLIVNAAQFNLAAGVDELRKVAGLERISLAVPVSFVLELSR